ncbi:glycine betaine ABC transporter substrate-binding protein [Cohnella thailandensis]|uniref:Osmoprotectant ABC transporter substrate-binding protein n=1 Tax=Cohnella thailandensis TaxID=557557 RepID=A0A841SX85_9BACL|nr:glycine betaine ABC transporter substrate-binding protein [Cohnella thailandensis]MBB6635246.1 osmoprotectant ABC transporter substrate-binding protein [Cohnella thailandensis]MBP1974286.1 osmoprotectant transport system substrate-binding protein [Cohnella thailandensis]
MRKQTWTIFAIVLLLAITTTACGSNDGNGSAASGTIKIGTQTYSEPKILAAMYKALIEDRTDIKVDIVPDLAASAIVIKSMKSNDIQMATLYSGEIFNDYFDIEDTKDRAQVLKQAQEGFDKNYGFKWYDSYGFENTYALAVRKDVAEANQLQSVSDLGKVAKDMKVGVDTTWLERENDGYGAFTDHYGFSFSKTYPMEISLVYKAAADKEVDVVLAYTTDAGLKQYDLQTLTDDKQFFPPYDASPVLRNDTLEKYPELDEVIPLLVGKIDAATMTALNYEVDVNKRTPEDVAVEFLKGQGLLK